MAGSGVTAPSSSLQSGGPPSLSNQIDQFSRLARHRIIEDKDLDYSVALIAFTGGHDYSRLNVATSSDDVSSLDT